MFAIINGGFLFVSKGSKIHIYTMNDNNVLSLGTTLEASNEVLKMEKNVQGLLLYTTNGVEILIGNIFEAMQIITLIQGVYGGDAKLNENLQIVSANN